MVTNAFYRSTRPRQRVPLRFNFPFICVQDKRLNHNLQTWHVNMMMKLYFMDRSIIWGQILWIFFKMQHFCLIWNFDLKMSRYDPTWRWYLNNFFLKNCLDIYSFQKKVVWNQYMHQWRWGVQKQSVYSKCTLFKIITLLHFVLLYICVQGQSLYVIYIGL